MPYGLVYYPNFEIVGLDEIRRRHDPTADLIEPHMGVMFLIPNSVGEGTVVRHLEGILKRLQPFAIRFHGLTKSWDHWLFLTLQEGNAEVLLLYDDIYSGPIARYRYDDVEFIPHVAIGLFAKNPDGYDHQDPKALELDEQCYTEALAEAESLGVDVRRVLDNLHLIRFDDELSQIVSAREFRVG